MHIQAFKTCAEPRAAVANVNANSGRTTPTPNRARGVNNENPNRVGNVESNPPAPPAPAPPAQPQNQEQGTPGETSGTPKCRKVYSISGINSGQEAHINLANMPAGSKRQVEAWAWGKKIKMITVIKKYGRWITPEVFEAFERMKAAAAEDDIKLKLNDGYRPVDGQRRLRRKFVLPDRRLDLTDQFNKKKYANFNDFAEYARGKPPNFKAPINRPGSGSPSHMAGVAIDIQTGIGTIFKRIKSKDRYPVYKWLVDNAHKFGFIRNIPKERWHYVYMGKPATKPTAKVKAGHWSWDDTLEGTPWHPARRS